MWTRKSLFALLLSLALCASSWAQALPSPSSSPATPVSAPTSTAPEVSWQTLDELLTMLESEATSLENYLRKLEASLMQAAQDSASLSAKLAQAQIAQAELSRSLALSEASLTASATSLHSAQTRADSLSRSRNLWRALAIVGGAGTIAAVTWGLTR